MSLNGTGRPVKVGWRFLLPLLLAAIAIVVLAMRSGEGFSVTYSPRLDAGCAMLRGSRIREEWETELTSLLGEYRALWSSAGPRLLSKAQTITGISPLAAAKIRLTLCNVPSQSIFGISVNMRFALKSYTATPVPVRYKVDTQFHELLHRMLDGHVARNSRLMAVHSNEPHCVRNHLHLLALQKAVLLGLDERAAFEDVVRIDSSLPNDCYKRSWDIVNATDAGYLSYLSEIRK